jgi:hypothetical protein
MKITEIREDIFQLALKSKDIETMHWYMELDDCFENDELSVKDLNNLKWRCMVLNCKKEPIKDLLWKIDTMVKELGYDLASTKTGLE